MKPNTLSFSRTAPEGTIHVRIVDDKLGDDPPPTVIISVGKAGSRLNAAADGGARLLGAAMRAGTSPSRLAAILGNITHESSNGHFEAKSLWDAVAQILEEFEEMREDLCISADPDPRPYDGDDESAEAVLGHA